MAPTVNGVVYPFEPAFGQFALRIQPFPGSRSTAFRAGWATTTSICTRSAFVPFTWICGSGYVTPHAPPHRASRTGAVPGQSLRVISHGLPRRSSFQCDVSGGRRDGDAP